jgi:uncharacterized lipoprotein YajG
MGLAFKLLQAIVSKLKLKGNEMKKLILLLMVLMLVGCGKDYVIKEPLKYTVKEPVSAIHNPETWGITYTVEYEDGTSGSKYFIVSKDLYDQYIKEQTSEVEFD